MGLESLRRRHTKRVLNLFSRWRLGRLGLLDCWRDYPPDAIKPKYQELWQLYRLVTERRPAVMVEFGGGYSTFVLAKAAQEAGAEFYSLDKSSHWQSVVRDRMPQSLRSHVRFH